MERKPPMLYIVQRIVCCSSEEEKRKAHEWRMNPFTQELMEAFRQLSKMLKKDGYSLSGIFGDKLTNIEDDYPIGHFILFRERECDE